MARDREDAFQPSVGNDVPMHEHESGGGAAHEIGDEDDDPEPRRPQEIVPGWREE